MSNWKWCLEENGKVIKGWYKDNDKWYLKMYVMELKIQIPLWLILQLGAMVEGTELKDFIDVEQKKQICSIMQIIQEMIKRR